jgi:hypothetical protein
MKNRIIAVLFALVFAISAFAIPASAASPYQTYTYSINGTALYSPDAYTPVDVYDSEFMGLVEKKLLNPTDMVVDGKQNVYIADRDNDRIVVLDAHYKLKFEITEFINEYGVPDKLTRPQGVFVTDDRIFVCDTEAHRIVTFDLEGN